MMILYYYKDIRLQSLQVSQVYVSSDAAFLYCCQVESEWPLATIELSRRQSNDRRHYTVNNAEASTDVSQCNKNE